MLLYLGFIAEGHLSRDRKEVREQAMTINQQKQQSRDPEVAYLGESKGGRRGIKERKAGR